MQALARVRMTPGTATISDVFGTTNLPVEQRPRCDVALQACFEARNPDVAFPPGRIEIGHYHYGQRNLHITLAHLARPFQADLCILWHDVMKAEYPNA